MKAYQVDEFLAEYAYLVSEGTNPLFHCLNCGSCIEVAPSLVTVMEAYERYIMACLKCGRLNKILTYEFA